MRGRRTLLIKFSLLLIWPVVMFFIAEVALRLLTDHPINRRSHSIPDPVLGRRLDPEFRGIDANGFRNSSVPDSADVVAIGDSHTYGHNAGDNECWPARLAELSGLRVYNFGIGGFGPIQYDVLIGEALKLSPRDVIIGLYLANDLNDITEGMSEPFGVRWAMERGILAPGEAGPEPEEADEREAPQGWAAWLMDESAVRSVLKSSAGTKMIDPGKFFVVEDERAPTMFGLKRMSAYSSYMDLNDKDIAAAFELTKKLLGEAQARTLNAGARLHVALIPSKQRVYEPYLAARGIEAPPDLRRIAKSEAEITERIRKFMEEAGIPFVEIYPAMAAALEESGGLYSNEDNGHPVGAGYDVYARAIWAHLQSVAEPAPLAGSPSTHPEPLSPER